MAGKISRSTDTEHRGLEDAGAGVDEVRRRRARRRLLSLAIRSTTLSSASAGPRSDPSRIIRTTAPSTMWARPATRVVRPEVVRRRVSGGGISSSVPLTCSLVTRLIRADPGWRSIER